MCLQGVEIAHRICVFFRLLISLLLQIALQLTIFSEQLLKVGSQVLDLLLTLDSLNQRIGKTQFGFQQLLSRLLQLVFQLSDVC